MIYIPEFTLLFPEGMGYCELLWPMMKAEAIRNIKEKDISNQFVKSHLEKGGKQNG